MPYTDQNGLIWNRSDNRLSIICEDGRTVYGNEEMSDEYLVSVSYETLQTVKTDAERIAELEAQLAAVLAKLSS
jgi:hypothetical protein